MQFQRNCLPGRAKSLWLPVAFGPPPCIARPLFHVPARDTSSWNMDDNGMIQPPLAALLDDLEHGDPPARLETAKMLARLDSNEAVSSLITLLQAAEDHDVRRWAAHALGFMGRVRAKTPLIVALRDPANDLEVRCHAAEALGHLLPYTGRHDDALRALHEVILNEGGAELRFWAAFALGAIGSEHDLPLLEWLAATDDRVVEHWWAVSKEATEAIEHIRGLDASTERDERGP